VKSSPPNLASPIDEKNLEGVLIWRVEVGWFWFKEYPNSGDLRDPPEADFFTRLAL